MSTILESAQNGDFSTITERAYSSTIELSGGSRMLIGHSQLIIIMNKSESKTPKFSIIINAYNGEKYLPEALESVFAQTCTDWELIIWDNQSTDNTAAICKDLDDDRVKYFYAPEHTTVGPARNLVVHFAKGDWLAFLDHDDIWPANKLALQSAAIDRDTSGKLGIVYGWALQFYQSEKVEPFDRWHNRNELPQGDVFQKLITMPSFISYSSVVLRRSAVLEIGGIPPSIVLISDYYYILMVARGYLAAALPELCCWYRKHEESISYSGTSKITVHYEVLEILDICEPLIDKALLKHRREVHQAHIGLLEILTKTDVWQGLIRIFKKGSIRYLATRPLTVTRRYIHNLFAPPQESRPVKEP
ncbi:MAG: glycosyltransferase involved in cell wall biosynthesis [Halioglobus sp.]